MDHDEAADHGARGGQSRSGDDQPDRREPDAGRGGGGEAEFGDPGGTELAQRGRLPARSNGHDADQRPIDAEVVPPASQPVLPGFEAAVIQYSRSGPLPSAQELAEYDRLLPGLAREIVNEAHANMASDRRISELAVATSAKLDRRGQWMAGGICGVCTLFALLCLFRLQPTWLAAVGAGIFGLGAVAPVINSFLERGGARDSGAPAAASKQRPTPLPRSEGGGQE